MPEFPVPRYITDPPVNEFFRVDDAARRWLVDLGEDAGGTHAETIDRLRTRLGASQDQLDAILEEATFQNCLGRALIDMFEAVPHEIEARQKFMRLARKTWGLPPSPGRTRLWITPRRHRAPSVHVPHSDLPGPLAAEWRDWNATWTAVVARNPPLELLQRMQEVFDNDSAGDAFGWVFGKERWFYEWLARGRRDPMPFADTHAIITEAYYSRLCELQALAAGWWCYDEKVERLRFVSLAEWESMSAKLYGLLDRHR
ncbi:hypothetical protein [Reyranella soli]|uniref:Uncharacterized protein n=1 Tax=Reyranella soli TaxID=1230389 RepID=A0A512N5K2_9HYPH|nr:hypothetical protein [Reyranella soli]GEP54255.1 hypothetical protein RSO01_14210 [Reyranella soli]